MTDAFPRIFDILLGHEGGFSNVAEDPGNWTGGAVGAGRLAGTRWGISAKSYPNLDIEHLSQADAQAIYRRDYWAHIAGDTLPPPLALLVFDAAVNNGCGRAARWLQGAVGVAADGVIGPATLAAVQEKAGQGADIMAEFMAQRMVAMAAMPGWPSFALGWARRLAALPYQAVALAAAVPQSPGQGAA